MDYQVATKRLDNNGLVFENCVEVCVFRLEFNRIVLGRSTIVSSACGNLVLVAITVYLRHVADEER